MSLFNKMVLEGRDPAKRRASRRQRAICRTIIEYRQSRRWPQVVRGHYSFARSVRRRLAVNAPRRSTAHGTNLPVGARLLLSSFPRSAWERASRRSASSHLTVSLAGHTEIDPRVWLVSGPSRWSDPATRSRRLLFVSATSAFSAVRLLRVRRSRHPPSSILHPPALSINRPNLDFDTTDSARHPLT